MNSITVDCQNKTDQNKTHLGILAIIDELGWDYGEKSENNNFLFIWHNSDNFSWKTALFLCK